MTVLERVKEIGIVPVVVLNKVEDTLNIIDKINILENSSLLKEVNECYVKFINNY